MIANPFVAFSNVINYAIDESEKMAGVVVAAVPDDAQSAVMGFQKAYFGALRSGVDAAARATEQILTQVKR